MPMMIRKKRSHFLLDAFIFMLVLLGFAINFYLWITHRSDSGSGIAGCGGPACEDALGSRWAFVFGVPVTVFGMAVYAGLMSAISPQFQRGFPWLSGALLGAALWFVFVQGVLIGKFCPWCMTAHGVGTGIVVLGLLRFGNLKHTAMASFFVVLGISLSQLYGPLPASHRLDDRSVFTPEPSPAVNLQGRIIRFDDGKKSYEVAALPRLGSADAKHVMVEYFDYQCEACKTMSRYLEALIAKHPDAVSCIVLPMPLDGACNPHALASNQHLGSCEIARIALGVWRENPGEFQKFHQALIGNPSLQVAQTLASSMIPPRGVSRELSDPWADSLIQKNIADWLQLSASTPKLPKLLIRGKRILHGLPSNEQDFIRVMERELGL
jgi:uncharacterized membrane protein